MDRLLETLPDRTGFVFKSLRQGESVPENIPNLLKDLLSRDKGLFLERFGRYLTSSELELFRRYQGIDFALFIPSSCLNEINQKTIMKSSFIWTSTRI